MKGDWVPRAEARLGPFTRQLGRVFVFISVCDGMMGIRTRALILHQVYFHLRHPRLQGCEQSVSAVCKSHRLWDYIIAAKTVFDGI